VTPGSFALSQTRSVSLDIELTTETDQTINVRGSICRMDWQPRRTRWRWPPASGRVS